ncbi:zinc finger MYND domain-containing protein 12 [Caerostris extrusa]|uniref:Zinc finger MYND domain-containing protein 12 n=1 Tax=Caerostris extrusa TaxID=172846 RepID=A0AAV4UQ49_CAEEX|nr:zinc finger MYND domain-containing protein 12 [Caerostris extrusa]
MSKEYLNLPFQKAMFPPHCEICGNKATTKCEICRVTHYCSQDHKIIDSISFHKKVCKKLADIRSEHPIPFQRRTELQMRKLYCKASKMFLKLAETVSKKWLLERKAINAYPSAMIAWNMSREMRSEDSSEVIYPTCLVSEMFLRLGDISAAEQYMVQASWISQKYDVLPHSILSKLYRIRGLVFMELKNWEQARTAFAEFAYAVASEYGIANVRLGIPYGLLGLSLLKFDNIDGATANFHKMADKWLDNLLSQYEVTIMRAATETEMAADEEIQDLEFQFMEAKIVFELMYEMVRNLEMNKVTDLINF